MNRTIHRHEIPVDDSWHTLELSGPIVHLATRTPYAVEVWAVTAPGGPTVARAFSVVATGQPLPLEAEPVGTVITPGGHLVWHLLERPSAAGTMEDPR